MGSFEQTLTIDEMSKRCLANKKKSISRDYMEWLLKFPLIKDKNCENCKLYGRCGYHIYMSFEERNVCKNKISL